MKREKIRVLFIGGYGRSGSTLLERILGQIDSFFSIGEVRHIWERSFGENQLCGCGEHFTNCSFWCAVIEEAFGGWNKLDMDEFRALKNSTDLKRYIPLMAMPLLRTSNYEKRLEAYSEILGKLYKAISKISGCRIIVDSSKNPSHGFLLHTISDIDLYVLHLVRDSRAVAFSWQRRKVRPEVYWKKEFMPRHSWTKSAVEWLVLNTIIESLAHMNTNYMLIRYEDLVCNLRNVVTQIIDRIGEKRPNLEFLDNSTVHLGKDHTVSGNPMRFKAGAISVSPDNEWEAKMRKDKKCVVSTLTWPLLYRYGYFLKC